MEKKEDANIKALLLVFKKWEAAVKMQIQSFTLYCKNVVPYDDDARRVERETLHVIKECGGWVAMLRSRLQGRLIGGREVDMEMVTPLCSIPQYDTPSSLPRPLPAYA
jgi:hypothetical protein